MCHPNPNTGKAKLLMRKLIFIVAAFKFFCGCIPFLFANEAPRNAETIRVMTFNIWVDGKSGQQPLSQTVKVIQAAKADIVGMQEVNDSAKEIADQLGWYHLRQRSGLVIFSRFEITGPTENRLGVKIRTSSSQSLYLFNTHLAHAPYQPYQLLDIPYAGAAFLKTEQEAVAAAQSARGKQVEALIKEISTIQEEGLPIFITGDFNEPSHLDWTAAAAKKGRHPLKVLYPTTHKFEEAGFIDALRKIYPDEVAHPCFTWTPLTKPDDPKDHHDRIDFVLFKGSGVQVTNVQIVGESTNNADIAVAPYPSDHRAVVAAFKLLSK